MSEQNFNSNDYPDNLDDLSSEMPEHNDNDSPSNINIPVSNHTTHGTDFRFITEPEPSDNSLMALTMSSRDSKVLVQILPELNDIAKRWGRRDHLCDLHIRCGEARKKNWWNFLFYWFLIGVVCYLNRASIVFLYIDPDGWGIPWWIGYVIGFGMIYLIDWAIKHLKSSELMRKFAYDDQKTLSKRQFNNADHPLQSLYDKAIDEEHQIFLSSYKQRHLTWLYLGLLFIILMGEALVSFYLLSEVKEIPWYLALTPLLSGSLNIFSGLYAGSTMEFPKKLQVLRQKIEKKLESI